jgi:hypothetical protein
MKLYMQHKRLNNIKASHAEFNFLFNFSSIVSSEILFNFLQNSEGNWVRQLLGFLLDFFGCMFHWGRILGNFYLFFIKKYLKSRKLKKKTITRNHSIFWRDSNSLLKNIFIFDTIFQLQFLWIPLWDSY